MIDINASTGFAELNKSNVFCLSNLCLIEIEMTFIYCTAQTLHKFIIFGLNRFSNQIFNDNNQNHKKKKQNE